MPTETSRPVLKDAPREPDAPRTRVSALDRALQVLDQLRETGSPMTAYDIARSTGAPLSTTYSIIDDMVAKNLLARASDRTVWLGSRLYGYGLLYASSLDFLEVAADEMQRLSAEVGETVQICGRDEGTMIVLQMTEGAGHFRVTSRVGSRMPINWTASGRLLVGHLPPARRLAFFAQYSRPSPTGRAETDPKMLSRLAGEAFAARLSVQIGESDSAVACLASPVLNAAGECVITMSIVLPENKALERAEYYSRAVQASAARVEQRLGWRMAAD